MDSLKNALSSADTSLRESIGASRSGVNSLIQTAEDAETSVVNAIESIDSQYENEVKGAWAKVKEFRAQYPGFVLGAVALGVGIPSARYGARTFVRNTALMGAATYAVMYPQLWGKPN
eukprot:TRINITY_DN5306_c0_g1_i1.p1 TRINITY_DN5306_c0_g1~~TRINITY_DN5306_c0_g1_i1.p1  ORF type:complete len:118 (+),score=10.96 TRINITY_DN5306_c0_g1_i1:107-460(+)